MISVSPTVRYKYEGKVLQLVDILVFIVPHISMYTIVSYGDSIVVAKEWF